MRGDTLPSVVTADEGVCKSEAVNELSAFFRPTPVDSPACNNGRIAIDAYPEIINDRRRGPDSWIINPGYPLLFIDQNITRTSECVIAGQDSVSKWLNALISSSSASRLAERRKSMVAPVESTARY